MIEQETKKRGRGRPSSKQEMDIDKVLAIAAKTFAANGFEGTRMNAIATTAGYTKSLMNYHFKAGKEELWKKTISKLALKLHQRFEEVESYFKDLEGLVLMKAFNRQFIYFSAENPEFYKMVFYEMGAPSERSKWLLSEILEPMHQPFEERFYGSSTGQNLLGAISPAHFFSLIIGAANIFFIHAFQIQNQYDLNPFDKKEIERYADFVNETVFARFESTQ